LQPIITNIII